MQFKKRFSPIDNEFEDMPYKNEEFENDPTLLSQERNTIAVVLIQDFFTDKMGMELTMLESLSLTKRQMIDLSRSDIYRLWKFEGRFELKA